MSKHFFFVIIIKIKKYELSAAVKLKNCPLLNWICFVIWLEHSWKKDDIAPFLTENIITTLFKQYQQINFKNCAILKWNSYWSILFE